MIDKICVFCKTAHSYVYDSCYSVYELVIKVVEKIDEVIAFVNSFQTQIDEKEDSVNITNNRALSETGDFTGTVCNGEKTACDIVNEIDSNKDNIQFLVNQFEDGATGLVVDGGFFGDDDINKNYDGGVW